MNNKESRSAKELEHHIKVFIFKYAVLNFILEYTTYVQKFNIDQVETLWFKDAKLKRTYFVIIVSWENLPKVQ